MRSTFFPPAKTNFAYNKQYDQFFISKKIKSFSQVIKSIQASQTKIGVSLGTSFFLGLACTGVLPFLGLALIGLASHENDAYHRNMHDFQEKLEELLVLYQWALAQGKVATHDPLVLQLLETIAPFIHHPKQLFPHDIFEKNSQKLSQGFIDILSRPPHRIIFHEALGVATDASIAKRKQENFTRFSRCEQLHSRLTLWVYGLQKTTPEETLPLPKKLGRHLT